MFTQITEHLAYLDMPCNVGMYMDGDQVYLVDAGLDARTGRKVYEELRRYQLQPKGLILTHAHADHFGGAAELKRIDPGIQVYASQADQPVFSAPEYEPYYLYGAAPLRDLCNKFLQAEPVQVDQILTPGEKVALPGGEYCVLDLHGHTPGQIGLTFPQEKVMFIADAIFTEKIIQKYRLLYHFDLKGAIDTLHKLDKLSVEGTYELFIPGHGKPYTSLQSPVINNLRAINETIERIQYEITKKPLTREEVVAVIIAEYQIPQTISQYFLTFSAIAAYLSYLVAEKVAEIAIREGKLFFTSR